MKILKGVSNVLVIECLQIGIIDFGTGHSLRLTLTVIRHEKSLLNFKALLQAVQKPIFPLGCKDFVTSKTGGVTVLPNTQDQNAFSPMNHHKIIVVL